jgi:NAD(P)-dependent dehydrogenase (short-subunit alcohol dehydrogenase family)
VADLDLAKSTEVASSLGSADVAVGVAVDVSVEDQVDAAVAAALLAFGGLDLIVNCAGLSVSKPLLETSEADWDVQHDVMAKGSFLVSKAAARVMVAQGVGGDIVYICSKNAVYAGPNNVAYSAAKADQAHQVRLLAAELGSHRIRVNGVNPDGVVRDSGIFAGGWGAERAKVYGVPEEELGSFYASRTLLGQEVLPDSVAQVVSALTSDQFDRTTGTIVPVDSGVAAAFLR